VAVVTQQVVSITGFFFILFCFILFYFIFYFFLARALPCIASHSTTYSVLSKAFAPLCCRRAGLPLPALP
jgi:hypothetical protein